MLGPFYTRTRVFGMPTVGLLRFFLVGKLGGTMRIARIITALVASFLLVLAGAGAAAADTPGMTHDSVTPGMTHD